MKSLKIVLIIILCGIMLLLGGFLAFVLQKDGEGNWMSGNGFAENWGKYELVLEKEVSAEGISSLTAQYSMNSNDVFFYESTSDTFVIKEYLNFTPEEKDISTITKDGQELVVKGGNRKMAGIFSFGIRGGYVEIYVPAGFAGDLLVSTISGDIKTNRAFEQMGQVSLSTVSGDILFQKVAANDVKMSTVSGDIAVTDLTGNAAMSTTSGDIRVEKETGAFTVSTVSGDVTLGEGAVCGTASTTSGDVRILCKELQGDVSVSTVSGDVFLTLPTEAAFDFSFDAVSGECSTFFDGELSYNKKRSSADGSHGNGAVWKVEVSTTSGDLRVTES